jgi:hypothetical protein
MVRRRRLRIQHQTQKNERARIEASRNWWNSQRLQGFDKGKTVVKPPQQVNQRPSTSTYPRPTQPFRQPPPRPPTLRQPPPRLPTLRPLPVFRQDPLSASKAQWAKVEEGTSDPTYFILTLNLPSPY